MEDKEVLNAEETGAFLGLHPDDVRRYARKGLIPCRKVGKRWLFHKTHLVAWLKGRGKSMPLQEKLKGLWPPTWGGSVLIDDAGAVILKDVDVKSSPARILLSGEYGGESCIAAFGRETLEALIPEDPELFRHLYDLLKISTGIVAREIGKAEI